MARMNTLLLYINDPVLGRFELRFINNKRDQIRDNIIYSDAFQRMRTIRQLGLTAFGKEYHTTHHTRYEHSLGCAFLAKKMCERLNMANESNPDLMIIPTEVDHLVIAALLHDVGHGPFSHSLDETLGTEFKTKHDNMTIYLIDEHFEQYLKPEFHVDMIKNMILNKRDGDKYYQNEMIAGTIDVDRIDFLKRDAFYIGSNVFYDADMLMDSLNLYQVDNQRRLCGNEYSEHVLTMFLLLRKYMYEKVYYEVQARSAAKMLQKAVEVALQHQYGRTALETAYTEIEEFIRFDDFEIYSILAHVPNKFVNKTIRRLKTENKYKAYFNRKIQVEDYRRLRFLGIGGKPDHGRIKDLEKELARKWKLEDYEVAIDVYKLTWLEELSMFCQTRQGPKPLESITQVANALIDESRKIQVVVYADFEGSYDQKRAETEAEEVLFAP